jgi:hypothetical protein
VFERAFKDFGLPLAIRTDNGVPFASRSAFFGLSGVAPLVKTDFSSGLSGSAWAVDSDVLFILDLRQWSWTRAVCRVQRQKLRLFSLA